MSRSGGQASSAVLKADCNIIWLPGIERRNAAAPLEPAGAVRPGISGLLGGLAGRPLKALAVIAALAGQAAALPIVLAAGTKEPWAAGAIFGAAAAIASWAGAELAGRLAHGQGAARRSCAAPQDFALHDAFTLALIVAASAALGGIGAALLLPAGAAVTLAMRRISRRRAAGQHGATLLLLVAIAMAGACGQSDLHAWAVAGIALAAAIMVRAGHSCLHQPQRQQMWHVWGMSALMCAAIAFAGPGRIGLPAALGAPELMPLLGGGLYGAGAAAAARILSRRHAQAMSAAVPFLAVALEIAFGHAVQLPQLAAAVLLAAALAGASLHAFARRREPALSAANGWPAGWPRCPQGTRVS